MPEFRYPHFEIDPDDFRTLEDDEAFMRLLDKLETSDLESRERDGKNRKVSIVAAVAAIISAICSFVSMAISLIALLS